MSRSDDERIADIIDACDEVATVVAMRSRAQAPESVLTRAAERLLEIIGEAATAMSTEGKERFPDVDWRRIGRLRIVLAHHYHRSDPALSWSFAEEQVPELAQALHR